MTSALNSLGRGTGRKFNMAAVKREMEANRKAREAKSLAAMARREAQAAYEIKNPVVIRFN
jgi:hypothetical protein